MDQALSKPGVKLWKWLRGIYRGVKAILWQLSRNKIGFLGFLIFVFFVLLGTVGPSLVPDKPTADVSLIYDPPSWTHLLGTDSQGKDILIQIVQGSTEVLELALLTGLISTFIGVTLGSLSAVIGGRLDAFLTMLADIWLTIPIFPLLAVLAALVSLNNIGLLTLVLAILSWAGLFRAIRAQVLSLKEREYVEAARALDLGYRHIFFSEILPNMMAYIAISFTFGMTSAIYAQVGLVFLGLMPMTRNWGVMINLAWGQGAIYYQNSVYFIMAPIAAIVLFQLSIVWMSRSLENMFNPRLKTG